MGVVYGAVIVVFFGCFAPKSKDQVPLAPAISAPVFSDFQTLSKRLPADSRIWTWWDNGFAIVDATGFGVYHDGAAQYTPQINIIARSFVANDNPTMHDLIAFVDRQGNGGIRRLAAAASSFDDLLIRIRKLSEPSPEVPVYVVYTADMILKYGAMRVLGGLSPAPNQRLPFGINWSKCEDPIREKIYCGGRVVDLHRGSIDSRTGNSDGKAKSLGLRRAIVIEGGRILRSRVYGDDDDTLDRNLTAEIILMQKQLVGIALLDEWAFESNLNQMFVLGRFDSGLFEEVYNNFPYTRVFGFRPH